MLKKSGLATAYSGIQCCIGAHGTAATSTSPSVLPIPRARPSTRSKRRISDPLPQWRSYATVKDSSRSYDFRDNMNWPCSHSKTDSSPTPYDIFQLEKGGIYSKQKFYELVKIYHPDRHTSSTNPLYNSSNNDALSPLERLERYRLVVQAHEILSDPIKRRAYDTYGAGWGADARNNRANPSRYTRGYASAAGDGRTYGTGPDNDNSPFANATWEDWERWYARSSPNNPRSRQAYEGTYVNPNAFASFVILFAVITGIAQATRAGQYSGSLEEKAAAFTEETSRFLTERAAEVTEKKLNREGRVRHFLEKRDPNRYGLKDEEEDVYRRHFGGEHAHMMDPSMEPAPFVGEKGSARTKIGTEREIGQQQKMDNNIHAERGSTKHSENSEHDAG